MTAFGIIYMPYNVSEALEVARAADKSCFTKLGICDSPILWHELYPTITACLMSTEQIQIGPNVTNPITRHWTTHASASRTLDELVPGRFFHGIGPGDGAVFTVGLKPAPPAVLEEALREVRKASPPGTEIFSAAGGAKNAAVAGRASDALIAGGGMDVEMVSFLRDRAQVAHREGPSVADRPPATWGLVLANIREHEDAVPSAKEELMPVAIAYARHAFSHTFEGKNVPAGFQDDLHARLSGYQFTSHAKPGSENPNAALLADRPDLEDYVFNRFGLVGTIEECRERVSRFLEESNVDGMWFSVPVPDPVGQVELLKRMLAPLVEGQAAAATAPA